MNGLPDKACLRQNNGKTEVYLQLVSGESVILRTFTEVDVQAPEWRYPAVSEGAVELSGLWNLRFLESIPEVHNLPDSVSLGSWTDVSFENAKTTMGTGCYTTTFRIENPASAQDWLLSLGDVRESARIRINGREITTLWAVPYSCSVGQYLLPGKNTLEIEVTNLPANRIADMDCRGVKWRIFKDINIAAAWL